MGTNPIRPRAGAALLTSLALVGAAWGIAVSAPALAEGLDLLASPAPVTRKGPQRLLVDVTTAGHRLVAVGQGGLVLRSDDRGARWTQAEVPTSVMLTSVTFADDRVGWAVGHDGVILGTRDGGVTWVRQFDGKAGDAQALAATQAQLARIDESSPRREVAEDALGAAEAAVSAGPSRPLMAVRFFDTETGFAAGAFGQLFRTDNGGRQWTYIGDRLDNLEGLHLNGLTLTPEGDVLVAAEAGTVFRSRDRGQTWTRSEVGYKGHLYGVLALPKSVLVAYGFRGHLFRSTDGGAHWVPAASRTTKTLVAGLLQGDRALLLDEEGQVLASTDAGATFSPAGPRLQVRRLGGFALAGGDTMVTVGQGGAAVFPAPLPRSNR